MSTTDVQTATGGFKLGLTERAAEEVQKFMDAESVSGDTGGMRVAVLPGGCSGFRYSLSIEEKAGDDDMVLEINGVRLFVDGFSAPYLMDVTVDYVSSMQQSGFTLRSATKYRPFI